MILTILHRYRRPIIIGLLPVMLLLLIDAKMYAQEKGGGERTSNIKWVLKGEVIVINYDLKGSPDTKYEISTVMKREGDPSFSVDPGTVEGDVGVGLFAGINKEIRWFYRRDIPQGLQGTDYYFEIHVKPVKEGSNLIYYVIGGAAVAGGIIALLVSKGQNTSVPPLDLPTPPGRPSQ